MATFKVLPWWVAVLAICLFTVPSTDGAVKKTRKRVVCYYTNWSVYRLGLAKFVPTNINPYLCTHLIYAFGGFDEDFNLQPFDKYQDIEKGGYARFNGLKQYNKGLRTLLALGGWNEGSGRFSELVAEPENRLRFIYNVIRFLRQYNFDGLDLDWEYPGSRAGSTPEDKENYATLCEELRAGFEAESLKTNRPTLLLTVAVPAGISTIEKGFNIPRLNAAVDFFNILAYDYHASTEALTDHHAPLFAPPGTSEFDFRSELNVDYTVRFYLKSGAERRKLVVGIPTYGRSYTLLDEAYNGVQAAAESPGLKGKYTKEEGYLSFYEVCELVAVDEWSVYRPYPEAMGPYATKGRQWVGYDDEQIVAKKAEYVRDNKLGGIMFWSVDNDDFRGRCSGKPYPLIESAKTALLAPPPGGRPKQEKGPTPPPPVTPDPGADFSCKREGFFAHPEECNKYFWCLAGGPLGIVPHSFTCPAGLLFNRNTDACDFPRNVKCKIVEKKVESITFPPTKEPSTIPPSTQVPGDVTPDPFLDFYEDYDTEDLPELDLDFPDRTFQLDSAIPSRATTSVLGGSRGGGPIRQDKESSTAGTKPTSSGQGTEVDETDTEELRELLELIQKLGGIGGVQSLLYGKDNSANQLLTEREKQTLNKIVGRQDPASTGASTERALTTTTETTSTRSRPQYTSISRGRAPGRGRAPDRGGAADLAPSSGRSRLRQGLASRLRRPQVNRDRSEVTREETEVIRSGSRTNARRRPQYTSIERARSGPSSSSEDDEVPIDEEDEGPTSGGFQREYVTVRRQRPGSRAGQRTDPEDQLSGPEDQLSDPEDQSDSRPTRRQYQTLSRSRPTTPVPPLEGPEDPRTLAIQEASSKTLRFRALPPDHLLLRGRTDAPATTSTTTEATSRTSRPRNARFRPLSSSRFLRRGRAESSSIIPPTIATTAAASLGGVRSRPLSLASFLRRGRTAEPLTTTTVTTTTQPSTTVPPRDVDYGDEPTTYHPVLPVKALNTEVQLSRPPSNNDLQFVSEISDTDVDFDSEADDEDRYDYIYEYVFEYPDGSVREIPDDQLEHLQEEIELAKSLLQAHVGKSQSVALNLTNLSAWSWQDGRQGESSDISSASSSSSASSLTLSASSSPTPSTFSALGETALGQATSTAPLSASAVPETTDYYSYDEYGYDLDDSQYTDDTGGSSRAFSTTQRPQETVLAPDRDIETGGEPIRRIAQIAAVAASELDTNDPYYGSEEEFETVSFRDEPQDNRGDDAVRQSSQSFTTGDRSVGRFESRQRFSRPGPGEPERQGDGQRFSARFPVRGQPSDTSSVEPNIPDTNSLTENRRFGSFREFSGRRGFRQRVGKNSFSGNEEGGNQSDLSPEEVRESATSDQDVSSEGSRPFGRTRDEALIPKSIGSSFDATLEDNDVRFGITEDVETGNTNKAEASLDEPSERDDVAAGFSTEHDVSLSTSRDQRTQFGTGRRRARFRSPSSERTRERIEISRITSRVTLDNDVRSGLVPDREQPVESQSSDGASDAAEATSILETAETNGRRSEVDPAEVRPDRRRFRTRLRNRPEQLDRSVSSRQDHSFGNEDTNSQLEFNARGQSENVGPGPESQEGDTNDFWSGDVSGSVEVVGVDKGSNSGLGENAGFSDQKGTDISFQEISSNHGEEDTLVAGADTTPESDLDRDQDGGSLPDNAGTQPDIQTIAGSSGTLSDSQQGVTLEDEELAEFQAGRFSLGRAIDGGGSAGTRLGFSGPPGSDIGSLQTRVISGRRVSGRIVPPTRLLNALNERRPEDVVPPLGTGRFSAPTIPDEPLVLPVPTSTPRRTPSTIRTFRPVFRFSTEPGIPEATGAYTPEPTAFPPKTPTYPTETGNDQFVLNIPVVSTFSPFLEQQTESDVLSQTEYESDVYDQQYDVSDLSREQYDETSLTSQSFEQPGLTNQQYDDFDTSQDEGDFSTSREQQGNEAAFSSQARQQDSREFSPANRQDDDTLGVSGRESESGFARQDDGGSGWRGLASPPQLTTTEAPHVETVGNFFSIQRHHRVESPTLFSDHLESSGHPDDLSDEQSPTSSGAHLDTDFISHLDTRPLTQTFPLTSPDTSDSTGCDVSLSQECGDQPTTTIPEDEEFTSPATDLAQETTESATVSEVVTVSRGRGRSSSRSRSSRRRTSSRRRQRLGTGDEKTNPVTSSSQRSPEIRAKSSTRKRISSRRRRPHIVSTSSDDKGEATESSERETDTTPDPVSSRGSRRRLSSRRRNTGSSDTSSQQVKETDASFAVVSTAPPSEGLRRTSSSRRRLTSSSRRRLSGRRRPAPSNALTSDVKENKKGDEEQEDEEQGTIGPPSRRRSRFHGLSTASRSGTRSARRRRPSSSASSNKEKQNTETSQQNPTSPRTRGRRPSRPATSTRSASGRTSVSPRRDRTNARRRRPSAVSAPTAVDRSGNNLQTQSEEEGTEASPQTISVGAETVSTTDGVISPEEVIRKVFNRKIEKTAVFVRRKPGSSEPEILGRGTVISVPGGDRQLILEDPEASSDITLLEADVADLRSQEIPQQSAGVTRRRVVRRRLLRNTT